MCVFSLIHCSLHYYFLAYFPKMKVGLFFTYIYKVAMELDLRRENLKTESSRSQDLHSRSMRSVTAT
jgi:hypothetical protein